MRNMIKIITPILLLGLLACTGGDVPSTSTDNASTSTQTKTFKVALFTWVGYGPVFIAQEKGFFEGIDVEISMVEDTGARRSALQFGHIDASMDIVSSFANFLASGFDGAAVLKVDDSIGGDGILTRNDVADIQALKGKSVAFPLGQPSHFFLLALLEEAGMTMADITPRYMEADAAGRAFESNAVDAAVTWEPWLTKASKMDDAKVLISSKEKPGLIADIFTVRNAYLKEHPEVVEAFIQGWFKAVDFWKNNPEEANRIMAERLRIEPAELEIMLGGIRYGDPEVNKAFFTKDDTGESNFNRLLSRASRTWLEQELIEQEPNLQTADGSGIVLKLVQ